MQYKVIPFVASIKNTGANNQSTQSAQQLEDTIKAQENQGWEYIRLESVTTFVQPNSGCFGFGGTPGYYKSYQMIVFQKQ